MPVLRRHGQSARDAGDARDEPRHQLPTSKLYEYPTPQRWDYLITVCDDANEHCPFFPGTVHRLHWSFADPSRSTGDAEERLAGLPPRARPDPRAPERLAPRPVTPARLVACVRRAGVRRSGRTRGPPSSRFLAVAAHERRGGLDHRALLRGLHGVGPDPGHPHRPGRPAIRLPVRRGAHGREPSGVRGFADGPWSAGVAARWPASAGRAPT